MQVDKPFISFSHLHKRFGAKRSSALRIRDLKVMLHERIRRHVGYVLMTHTFRLEGGRDPSLCSQRERTSDHTGHLCCKFISHKRMPQYILKIVKLIKSVFFICLKVGTASVYPFEFSHSFLRRPCSDHLGQSRTFLIFQSAQEYLYVKRPIEFVTAQ